MSRRDKRLYLDNSYLFEFESTVLQVEQKEDCVEIRLKETAFYPESGGQLADLGTLDNIAVDAVFADDNDEVIHRCSDWKAEIGQTVRGVVDQDWRLDNMRKHTGQHILSQAFLRQGNAETVGAHLGETVSTIELAVTSISDDALYETEKMANGVILQNLPVSISYHEFDELERLGVRRIPNRTGQFRLVGIGDFELTACGGTHCKNSGEIGLIKIVGLEKIRNHCRIAFLTGRHSVDDYYQKSKVLDQLSSRLTCHFLDVDNSVGKLIEQNENLRNQVASLNKELLPYRIDNLKESAEKISGIHLIVQNFPDGDTKDMRDYALNITKSFDSIVLFGLNETILISASPYAKLKASQLADLFREKFGGKGGGNPALAQVGGIDRNSLPEQLEQFAEIVKEKLAEN